MLCVFPQLWYHHLGLEFLLLSNIQNSYLQKTNNVYLLGTTQSSFKGTFDHVPFREVGYVGSVEKEHFHFSPLLLS